MERLVLLSARRFDLNMVPRPAVMPRSRLLWAEPLTRKPPACISVLKVRVGRPGERGKAGDTLPQLTSPISGPKVAQQPDEHFIDLSYNAT
jgi:hypothetical protein